MKRYIFPIIVIILFGVLVAFLYRGLDLNPRNVPSPLIDKPAPDFNISTLSNQDKKISLADLKGQVWVLNVWASWCVSCRTEHPILVDISKKFPVTIYGLNYKDTSAEASNWLKRLGNPYKENLFDQDGRLGIDFGVYGVPETFVIDDKGIIRYKHTGPVGVNDWLETLWPIIKELQESVKS